MIVLVVLFLVLVISIAISAAFSSRGKSESLKPSVSTKKGKKVKFNNKVKVREFNEHMMADVSPALLSN